MFFYCIIIIALEREREREKEFLKMQRQPQTAEFGKWQKKISWVQVFLESSSSSSYLKKTNELRKDKGEKAELEEEFDLGLKEEPQPFCGLRLQHRESHKITEIF